MDTALKRLLQRLRHSPFAVYCVVLFCALALRLVLLSGRALYWDDLVIPAYFFHHEQSPWLRLFSTYDGHFFPASAALQYLVFRISGLQWWLPALLILLASTVSLWLWWRVLILITDRWLIPLVLITFSPFLLAASGWWSTAVNAYAWQISCAAVLLYALRGRSILAALCLLAGLFFTEKALSILPVVCVLFFILRKRHAWRILLPSSVVALSWALLFLWRVSSSERVAESGDPARELLSAIPSSLFQLIGPGTIGGPWQWSRWSPGIPFAAPSQWLAIAGCCTAVIILLLIARRSWLAVISIVGYYAAIYSAIIFARAGQGTSDVLLRTPHYFADAASVAVLCGVCAYARPVSLKPRHIQLPAHMAMSISVIVSILFIFSSSISTLAWRATWSDDHTGYFLNNLTQSYNDPSRFLDQEAPLEVLMPVLNPYNRLSNITGVEIPRSTTDPHIINVQGNAVPGAVLPVARIIEDQPETQCGTRIYAGTARWLMLDNPLPFGMWTLALPTAATTDLNLTISAPNGLEDPEETAKKAVHVGVGKELTTHYIRIDGGGGTLLAQLRGKAGESICIGQGHIGPLIAR